MGNPSALALGPGNLYHTFNLSATEPVDLAAGWLAPWVGMGYTEEGTTLSLETKMEDVEVAEELDPVLIVASGRTIMVSLALAEITATNLKRANNGGAVTTSGGVVYYDPPAIGAEVYCMLGWESQDVQERWIFRKCIQTGKIDIKRQKAPNKATIPMEYRCVKPTGLQPYRTILANPARV